VRVIFVYDTIDACTGDTFAVDNIRIVTPASATPNAGQVFHYLIRAGTPAVQARREGSALATARRNSPI
jgi:hypothetical protein